MPVIPVPVRALTRAPSQQRLSQQPAAPAAQGVTIRHQANRANLHQNQKVTGP
jgi:hypothetical protein